MPGQAHRDESSSPVRWLSIGNVRDDEIVLRTLLNPTHVKDGRVIEVEINLDDLMQRGYSVDRKRFTSAWRVRLYQIRKLRKLAFRVTAWTGVCFVSELRKHRHPDDQLQALAVTEAPLLLNPAHAQVISAAERTKSKARKLRKFIAESMKPVQFPRYAFEQTDRYGWSRGIFAMLCSFARQAFSFAVR